MSLARSIALATFVAGPRLPAVGAALGAAPDSSARAAVARAVRAEVAPLIDGREGDAVWSGAPAFDEFVEFQPTDGKAPRFRTAFKAAYDDRNLYVFVRAYDPRPDSIMTALTRRDVRGPSDQIKIIVDAYFDHRSGYEFAVNPVGVKRDYSVANDYEEDDSWDGVWDVGTAIDSLGWTAEFRIPFSQLRYANKRVHTFGFGIWRDLERYKERTAWPRYRPAEQRFISQLGRLEGISDIAEFRRLEVTPYALAKTETEQRNVAGPSFGQTQRGTMGMDLKYGITPNLTLDATVNPDFGQVEADPAVLNLSAFETFFQERRPFFVEGTGLYRYDVACSIVTCSGEGLFYSRRIGRGPDPRLVADYGDARSPDATRILGAAKLTGRLPGGLNVGLLEAVTDRMTGTQDRTIEPRTNYAVLRAQQDLRRGESGVGFIVTAVNRGLDQWTESVLRRDAYAAGASARHRFARGKYQLSASLMASRVRGTAGAIDRTQTSPVHLYQRPDDRLAYDPTRTELSGDAEEIALDKISGRLVRFQTAYQRQSPGFETNDLGYLRRANRQSWTNWMGLSFRQPKLFYRQMSGNFNYWSYWTADGLPTERAVNTNWHVNLKNQWWVHAGGTLSQLPGTYCDNCARGGPAFRRSPFFGPWVGVQGDDRQRVVPALWLNYGRGDYGASRYYSLNPEAEFRLSSQFQLSASFNLEHNIDDSQWFGRFTDPGPDGRTHYAFAHLDQRTTSLSTRWSYAITPTLTFQLYAQPFVTRGEYTDIRELSATPRARRYEDRYTPYTPDGANVSFDFKQLRSNSVVRWEFRPGSSLYVVWAHGREAYNEYTAHRGQRPDENPLLALHPENTLLVKVAYWLSR